jgi:hypothetical protein
MKNKTWQYQEKSARLQESEDRVNKRICSERSLFNRKVEQDIKGYIASRKLRGARI